MNHSKSNFTPFLSGLSQKWRIVLPKFFLITALTLVIAVAALPGYFRGTWQWQDIPKIAITGRLNQLQNEGISLPGWQTVAQKRVEIGANKWSFQVLQKGDDVLTLYLMPQNYYKKKPYVEWVDLQGITKWKTDDFTTLVFESAQKSPVTARFFQARNRQTFAIVQWYAYPNGGHFVPAQWFWRDQWARLQQNRLPWIAVCLQIPVDPLSQLEDHEALAKSLGQAVQNSLEKTAFQP